MDKKSDQQRMKAQGFVEYALILVLIVVITLLGLALMGQGIKETFCQVAAAVGAEGVCSQGCQDDFANMDGWKDAQGNWAVKDSRLCNGSSGEGRLFNTCSRDLPSNDYTIDLHGANLAKGNGYGVWFRSSVDEKGRRNGYTFQYDPGYGDGAFIFRKWVNGNELPPFAVKKDKNFDWTGEDHDIQVVVEGNKFTALVDGKPVLVGHDSTYAEGEAGLRTWDSTEMCLDGFDAQPIWSKSK